jgi:hypothetical protein
MYCELMQLYICLHVFRIAPLYYSWRAKWSVNILVRHSHGVFHHLADETQDLLRVLHTPAWAKNTLRARPRLPARCILPVGVGDLHGRGPLLERIVKQWLRITVQQWGAWCVVKTAVGLSVLSSVLLFIIRTRTEWMRSSSSVQRVSQNI